MNQIVLECCDSAITDDLQENHVSQYLNDLVVEELISTVDLSGDRYYSITPAGILYVRKRILKPIINLSKKVDYQEIIKKIDEPSADAIRQSILLKQDKQTLSEKVLSFGANNIGPLVKLINSISE